MFVLNFRIMLLFPVDLLLTNLVVKPLEFQVDSGKGFLVMFGCFVSDDKRQGSASHLFVI